jgi:hypothetical protein
LDRSYISRKLKKNVLFRTFYLLFFDVF